MHHPLIVVRQPRHTTLHVLVKEPLVVGRECEGLQLADPQMSRRHLVLEPATEGLDVTDLGSTNGTHLDGRPLTGTARLSPRQVLRLGDCTIELDGARPESGLAGNGTMPALSDHLRSTSIDLVAAAVVDERPPIPHDDAGTVTIVFCDIEDSTAHGVAMGDMRWMEVLAVHNAIVRRQVARHRGREIKAQGDGFMLSFPGARAAIDAMVEAQRALQAWARSHPTDAVRVRVGIHTGEALVGDKGDLFGKHVVVAARVAGAARGGEILVSSLVHEIVETRGDLTFGPPREVELKGIGGTSIVHPVRWIPD